MVFTNIILKMIIVSRNGNLWDWLLYYKFSNFRSLWFWRVPDCLWRKFCDFFFLLISEFRWHRPSVFLLNYQNMNWVYVLKKQWKIPKNFEKSTDFFIFFRWWSAHLFDNRVYFFFYWMEKQKKNYNL